MNVVIFGTGYVGLVQGAVLADVGHRVICIDVDEEKINQLQQGIIPIYEPGLEEIVTKALRTGHLNFTTDIVWGMQHASIVFIAVGTPQNTDGSADLSNVYATVDSIAAHLNGYTVIVTKSTVPVGTTKELAAKIRTQLQDRNVSCEYDVVSNPEFLKEGSAIIDCQKPDRIIIGTDSQRAEQILRDLYRPFNRNHDKIILMDVNSAELTKYAANCMLATKISFMNEMANIAEKMDADIESVRLGIGSDPRIGYHFIYPGSGYGGSCFPKDILALIQATDVIGFDAKILKAVEDRNVEQKKVLFNKILQFFNGDLNGRVIALWGLTFKPNTDDVRAAVSRTLMESLWMAGARVQAYDPVGNQQIERIYGTRSELVLMDSKEAVLEGADVLAIVTEWQTFRAPDFELMRAMLKYPVIFDGRNLYDPVLMSQKGFIYKGIGRESDPMRHN